MPKTTGRGQTPDAPDPGQERRPSAAPPTSGALSDLGATAPKAKRRRTTAPGAGTQEETPGRHRNPDQAAPPAYDDIARRAYELYQERGGSGGQEVDDWLRAEAELRNGRGRRDDEV